MATNETNTGTLQPKTDQAVAPRGSNSERFTAKVMKEFGSSAGVPQVTDFQRQLIQGYFISIDRALKAAEEERLRKNANNKDHKYDNDLPVTWENVNLTDLALDVVHYARMGLDMMQDNHLFPIPYKNNKAQRYDVTLMPGYNGIRYIAEKYALEPPPGRHRGAGLFYGHLRAYQEGRRKPGGELSVHHQPALRPGCRGGWLRLHRVHRPPEE